MVSVSIKELRLPSSEQWRSTCPLASTAGFSGDQYTRHVDFRKDNAILQDAIVAEQHNEQTQSSSLVAEMMILTNQAAAEYGKFLVWMSATHINLCARNSPYSATAWLARIIISATRLPDGDWPGSAVAMPTSRTSSSSRKSTRQDTSGVLISTAPCCVRQARLRFAICG